MLLPERKEQSEKSTTDTEQRIVDPESNTVATTEHRSGPFTGVIDAANVQFAKGVDVVRSAIHVPATVMAYPLKQAPEVQQMERTVSNLIRASAALFLFVCGNIDSFNIIGAICLVASLHVFWRSAAGLSTAAIYAKRFRMIGGFILFISVWSLIIKLGMGVGGAPHALSHVDEAVFACKSTPAPQLQSCGHVENFARVFMTEMSRRNAVEERAASFPDLPVDFAYFAAVDYMAPMHEHMQGHMAPSHHEHMHGHSDDDDDKAMHGHKEYNDEQPAAPLATRADFMKWLLEHKRQHMPADGAEPEPDMDAEHAAHLHEWRTELESKAPLSKQAEAHPPVVAVAAETEVSNWVAEPNATSGSVGVAAPLLCVTDRRVGKMAAESLFVASASMIRCEHLPTWESKCEAVGRFVKASAWWLLAAIVLYQVGQVLAAALVFKYASRLVKLSHVEA